MTTIKQKGNSVNLHNDLKDKVKASGFTMTAVCERAGVSTGTPPHWEAGRAQPNQSTYDKMVAALRDMVQERDAKIKAAGLQ